MKLLYRVYRPVLIIFALSLNQSPGKILDYGSIYDDDEEDEASKTLFFFSKGNVVSVLKGGGWHTINKMNNDYAT